MTSSNTRLSPLRVLPRRRGRITRTSICLAIGAALAMPAVAQEPQATQVPQSTSTAPERTSELDAVSVRGEYIPEPMANTAAVSSFVTREDFERTGDSDAAAALVRSAA